MTLAYRVELVDQKTYDASEIKEKLVPVLKKAGDFAGKTVFMKPSFVFPSLEEVAKGIVTNMAVVLGAAKAFEELGASKVWVAEHATTGCARYTFNLFGVKRKLKEFGCERTSVLFLDEEKPVRVDVKDPYVADHFDVSGKLLDADYFVTLPKLKTNIFAGVTLSVKNHLGLISPAQRRKYHDARLHKEIADLYTVRVPDICITDAVFAGEGQGPVEIEPVNLGLLVVGTNGLAVDTVCCRLMGIDPSSVEHLVLLNKKGVGPVSLTDVQVSDPALLDSRRRDFRMPVYSFDDLGPNIRAFVGKKKACAPGCLGMLRAFVDGYGRKLGYENVKINLIFGDDVDVSEETLKTLDKRYTIVYGDCAKKYRKYGHFYKGCPPDYLMGLAGVQRQFHRLTPWLRNVKVLLFGRSYARYLIKKTLRI